MLAEMLRIYHAPDKGAADLYLWLHHSVDEIRQTVDRENHLAGEGKSGVSSEN